MNLVVKETRNINEIHAILKRPDIYENISCDDSPCSEHFTAPVSERYRYIAAFVDGEIIGLMVYHSFMDGEVCHIQVLPEFRKCYAKEFGEKALKFKGDCPLYSEIPDNYQNVLNFAKSFGFEVIEKLNKGYCKNGIEYQINLLRFNYGVC